MSYPEPGVDVARIESAPEAGRPSFAAQARTDGVAGAPAPVSVAPAVQELARLTDLSLVDHPDVYERILGELQGALADIDDA